LHRADECRPRRSRWRAGDSNTLVPTNEFFECLAGPL
jgi:hypothetical protein